jgi:uncharacterized membrane protein YkvA (DUF1232 family)
VRQASGDQRGPEPGRVRVPGRPGRVRWFRREILALFFAVGDRRTPVRVKLLIFFALFYLVDPIDLIPDMIPLVGYLDDLIIVPLLLHLAFRWLPLAVREESLVKADRQARRIRLALLVLVIVLLGMLVGMFFLGKEMAEHFR